MPEQSWRVMVPTNVHPAGPDLLAEFAEVRTFDEATGIDVDLETIDAIIVRTFELDAAFFARASGLAVVSKHGIGLDNVDVDAATANDVLVCNVPDLDSNGQAVAEHAIAMVLALRKHLPRADAAMKDGRWARNDYVAPLLRDDVMGLFGIGNIGARVATLAGCLGMTVVAFDPYVAEPPTGVDLVDTRIDLFEAADVVSIHAPLTEETRGAVGSDDLACLDEHGILVNTARGGIVDEDALVDALEAGTLAGAGIDTFAEEPPPAEHPLFAYDTVITTPHCAGASEESLHDLSRRAAAHVRDVHRGRPPETVVNPSVLD